MGEVTNRVWAVFAEAIEIADPRERAAYVSTVCGTACEEQETRPSPVHEPSMKRGFPFVLPVPYSFSSSSSNTNPEFTISERTMQRPGSRPNRFQTIFCKNLLSKPFKSTRQRHLAPRERTARNKTRRLALLCDCQRRAKAQRAQHVDELLVRWFRR
jgi:hypothetical protein